LTAPLKGGKKADVRLVRAGGQTVAAKVYKARQTRSVKNDAAYSDPVYRAAPAFVLPPEGVVLPAELRQPCRGSPMHGATWRTIPPVGRLD
jgi:hypothetical protein